MWLGFDSCSGAYPVLPLQPATRVEQERERESVEYCVGEGIDIQLG